MFYGWSLHTADLEQPVAPLFRGMIVQFDAADKTAAVAAAWADERSSSGGLGGGSSFSSAPPPAARILDIAKLKCLGYLRRTFATRNLLPTLLGRGAQAYLDGTERFFRNWSVPEAHRPALRASFRGWATYVTQQLSPGQRAQLKDGYLAFLEPFLAGTPVGVERGGAEEGREGGGGPEGGTEKGARAETAVTTALRSALLGVAVMVVDLSGDASGAAGNAVVARLVALAPQLSVSADPAARTTATQQFVPGVVRVLRTPPKLKKLEGAACPVLLLVLPAVPGAHPKFVKMAARLLGDGDSDSGGATMQLPPNVKVVSAALAAKGENNTVGGEAGAAAEEVEAAEKVWEDTLLRGLAELKADQAGGGRGCLQTKGRNILISW